MINTLTSLLLTIWDSNSNIVMDWLSINSIKMGCYAKIALKDSKLSSGLFAILFYKCTVTILPNAIGDAWKCPSIRKIICKTVIIVHVF